MNAPFFPMQIAGSGGGKSGGGGDEAANTLKSRQTAKLVDALSEGPIRGVVSGIKGVYYDGVVLQNTSGTKNFTNANVQFVNGYPDQPIMKGFTAQQTETSVSQQILFGIPLIRSIVNTDTDRARITVSVPSLQEAQDDGGIKGASVKFRIELQTNGGGYRSLGDFEISGKTTSKYQRAIAFLLPEPGPWDIRLTRLTKDSTSSKLQNDLYWDSYTALIDARVNYTLTACVGTIIDSKQFSSIPKRTFLTDGLLVNIPTNYNPDAATYDGVWDGNFKTDWTNNPAWVLYDLVVQSRYGIGDFIKPEQVDKWALYKIAKWCDERINNGKGGTERRWTCNIQIMDQQQAFDLLNQIAGVFRGFMYWNGGQMVAVADQPKDPVMSFTNANVIDGTFNYAGSDIRARHTMAQVSWKDPTRLGDQRVANCEVSKELISRYGIQKTEFEAVGCTRESQALRTGNWTLYTEHYEGEVATHKGSYECAYLHPGDIFQVSDVLIAGSRRGGRVGVGSTNSSVATDAPLDNVSTSATLYLSCVMSDGTVQTRQALAGSDPNFIPLVTPFSEAPLPDTVWVLSEVGRVEPTLWRTLSTKQSDVNVYDVEAQRHFPQKWDYIENNLAFSEPSISTTQPIPDLPTDLRLLEYIVQTSAISLAVRGTLSWISTAPRFRVGWRIENGNWEYAETDQKAIDLPLTAGNWEFMVIPISPIGMAGPTARLDTVVAGLTAPPQGPLNLRVNVVDGVALFEWSPTTELDVKIGGHYELRHTSSTGTGATWVGAQTIIPTIPGASSSVETSYRTGTWFLRTFDSSGQPSATWGTIIADDPDERFTEYARICESPDWLGHHDNTQVRDPEEWLTLGATGELWDAQLGETLDTWPDIDVLGDVGDHSATHGEYTFFNQFDAGGVFPIRFSTDILAFAFEYPDSFIDSRQTNADDWTSWDDLGDDLEGRITLQIRTTNDDPTSPSALWSDWSVFNGGTYTARGFQFKAILDAPEGQNIGVETLCILADFREKIDHGDDVVYSAADLNIPFNIKFYLVPAVTLTIQDAQQGDTAEIIFKSRESFTVRITNAGVQVNRTFDWHAMGY